MESCGGQTRAAVLPVGQNDESSGIFNIPHLPESISAPSRAFLQSLSPNTCLTPASEQYCPYHPVWGPGSTVRGEQWMCYSTVGWVPPAPPPNHDYTHMSHIKQALSRTLAFVPGCWSSRRSSPLLCSDHMRPWAALLLSPRRWLRRDDPAPSPSWIHSYLCALSVPLRLPIGKSSPAWFPFSSRLPGSFYRCGESQPRSMIILLYRVRTDAHSPRLETRSPRLHPPAIMWTSPPSLPSSLRSSLPLIQQLPAGLVHAESPEYCWPGGSSAPWNSRWLDLKYKEHNHRHHGSRKERKGIFCACMPRN